MFYFSRMKRVVFVIASLLFYQSLLNAQPFAKVASNAFLITRMAEKFHVHPVPVDDAFSAFVWDKMMNELDDEKIYFTQEDMAAFQPYRLQLDNDILKQKTNFLQAVTSRYTQRLHQSDSLISLICQKPFVFTANETLTVAEDTSFPANETALRTKLYKVLKYDVLDAIADDSDFTKRPVAQQKKYVDSIEPVLRHKMQNVLQRGIKIMFQSPGGIPQYVGDEYCKAIALCYDPHTEFFPATEEENFESELGAEHVVFGFGVKEDKDEGVLIDELAPGSPAYKSGQLNTGDKIETLQWSGSQPVDVSTATTEEIKEILNASNHEKLIMQVKKADGSLRQVTLVKEKMETDEDDDSKVRSFILKGDKNIGYISLPAFYTDWDENSDAKGCANDVAKEIIKLKKENIQGLILDLRYNGGGSVQEAVELSGIFIDAGPVQQIKGKEAKVFTLKDVNRGTIYNGPLVIMINGYSASASEMFAGAMQDYHRAIILGSPSYGKATMQQVLPLDTTISEEQPNTKKQYDNYLKITDGQVYRVSGATAQLTGVVPDVILPEIESSEPERESLNPHALPAVAIDANKYYQPLKSVPTAGLQAMADSFIAISPYYAKLKKYNAEIEKERVKKDISLQLQTALQQTETSSFSDTVSSADKLLLSLFTVQNNAYEKERLQIDERQSEAAAEWKHFLQKDAALKVAYKVVAKLPE